MNREVVHMAEPQLRPVRPYRAPRARCGWTSTEWTLLAVAVGSVLVAVLTVVLASLRAPEPYVDPTVPPLSTSDCTEDRPCWDCSSMGNELCGVGQWLATVTGESTVYHGAGNYGASVSRDF